ncbi:MAG: amidohydrolase family protein [Balneolaceae bacterium]|nr:amidohydrolase family protein [Balneolaceae bacterium]
MVKFHYVTLLWTILLTLLSSNFVNAQQAPQSKSILITNATILDGVSEELSPGRALYIQNGKISSILNTNEDLPKADSVIDAGNRYVLPGLIDAHTHISSLASAERALLSGVTTLRTAGSDSYHDIAIHNLVRHGKLSGPEIVGAGIFVQPDLGEDLLADRRFAELPNSITSEKALRRLVQINVDRGARVIKTRATERAGSPDTDPRKQVYSRRQLEIIVDEASEHGIPVMAHSHGSEGSAAAVSAGVKSIEHGTYLNEETIREMKQRGTYLVPTYTTVVDLTEPGGDYDHPVTTIRGLHMLPRMEQMIKTAMKHNINIVASTDSGYDPESINRVAMEAANFVALGMSPFDAIRSCTSLAATLLEVSEHTGRVAEGYDADLIIVERNPLEDIRSLQDAVVILSNGTVVKNRLPFALDP